MKFTLISDTDSNLCDKTARLIYAETGGISLPLAEGFASMIRNISRTSGRSINDVISDADIFDSLNPTSCRHGDINVPASNPRFQMCMRVARRMIKNNLADSSHGATRFHRADVIPAWATSRGYIADIDGFLFYI